MPDKANDPDTALNQEIVQTSEDLIERSRRLLADLDSELGARRPGFGIGGRRSA